MSGHWRRLGRLDLDTSRASAWAVSHAALPMLDPIDDGSWHLYLSLRDAEGRARIGRTVLTMHPTPALAPLDPIAFLDFGERGTFDDNGVVGSCIVRHGGVVHLFYTGWRRGVTVPFYLDSGVALGDGSGPFTRRSRAPLLPLTDAEPFLSASPFVRIEDGRWRMWYVAGAGWHLLDGRTEPRYHLRYAESADGVTWNRQGTDSIQPLPGEYAFGRAWVTVEDGRYHMWFPVRGARYQIGYAHSADGLQWTRADEDAGLASATADADAWDRDMVAYPCVFTHQARRYMLYNGNDYGRTGVGLAVWEPA